MQFSSPMGYLAAHRICLKTASHFLGPMRGMSVRDWNWGEFRDRSYAYRSRERSAAREIVAGEGRHDLEPLLGLCAGGQRELCNSLKSPDVSPRKSKIP